MVEVEVVAVIVIVEPRVVIVETSELVQAAAMTVQVDLRYGVKLVPLIGQVAIVESGVGSIEAVFVVRKFAVLDEDLAAAAPAEVLVVGMLTEELVPAVLIDAEVSAGVTVARFAAMVALTVMEVPVAELYLEELGKEAVKTAVGQRYAWDVYPVGGWFSHVAIDGAVADFEAERKQEEEPADDLIAERAGLVMVGVY